MLRSRLLALATALALLASSSAAQRSSPSASFDQRYAQLATNPRGLSDAVRLRRLLALDWEYTMVTSPEYATAVGYPGQNARWTDLSLDAIAQRKRELQRPLRVLRTIRRARLSAADRLNYDLFLRGSQDALDGARFPSELLAVTQRGGPQYLADVIAELMPRATVRDYEDILARLDGLPAVIDQTTALLRAGLARGITPPRITLRDVPDQIARLVPDDPMQSALLAPFAELPPTIPAAEQQRLRDAALAAYRQRVAPAYHRLRAYLADSYIPGARETIGASALPDGAAWYAYAVRTQTTTDLTPRRIHELGLAEVARIRAQMDSLIVQTGFSGDFRAFVHMLRTDPRFYHTDSASLVQAYRDIAKRLDPELPKQFGKLPRLTYGVTTIPSYQAKSQTTAYYQAGSPATGRPGYYFVNTYALDARPKWEMEALTMHEAVPGHHLQIALAQELENTPDFRRYGGYTAFVEGWALYSESLGSDLGMYQDPYSRFGALTYEMWRAIRLVLDTGIHDMGWSRQQAIDYFVQNSAKTEHDIVSEVDRYIIWPGQALAYKLGQLKIRELRRHAESELGGRFDVRAFHDEVLDSGALPLDVLDARVRRWVAARKAGPSPRVAGGEPATR